MAVFLWGLWCITLAERASKNVAIATFAAVVLNPYWVSWHVAVKTYAMANLLVTITTLCLYLAFRSGRARWCLAAGLALGTCISLRSFYGPLFPLVLLWLFFTERRDSPTSRKALAFLSGSLIGLLPMVVSFLRDPGAFYFNNIQYHRLDVGYLTGVCGPDSPRLPKLFAHSFGLLGHDSHTIDRDAPLFHD